MYATVVVDVAVFACQLSIVIQVSREAAPVVEPQAWAVQLMVQMPGGGAVHVQEAENVPVPPAA